MTATTRSTARPTVRELTRDSRATDVLSILVASHASRSSKSAVRWAPGRAKGTPSTTTPWAGQPALDLYPPHTQIEMPPGRHTRTQILHRLSTFANSLAGR